MADPPFLLAWLQALDKMEDVEDVEDEAKVTIHLPEPGPIGRPIVQVRYTRDNIENIASS